MSGDPLRPARHASARAGPRAAPRAVLFDVDGTLVSTRRLYLEAYRRALAPYLGRELDDAELLALRARSERELLLGLVGAAAFDACVAGFRRHYQHLLATHFDGIFPGIPELLARIRAAGLRTGVVTGKSRASWDVSAALHDLGPFDAAIFDDDVRRPKPDPEGLLLALGRLSLRPAEALYVGDTIGDLDAAIAAGAAPVVALWSRPAPEAERLRARAASRPTPPSFATAPADVLAHLGL